MMKLLRSLIILAILVGVVGGGYYYYKTYIVKEPIDNFPTSLQALQPLAQQGLAMASQVAPQAAQLSKVLGATDISVSTNPNSATASISGTQNSNQNIPIQEKVFEYARYTYCQQVVKDYESRNPGGINLKSTP